MTSGLAGDEGRHCDWLLPMLMLLRTLGAGRLLLLLSRLLLLWLTLALVVACGAGTVSPLRALVIGTLRRR